MEIDWMPAGSGKVLHAVRRGLGSRNSLCFQLCTPIPRNLPEGAGRATKCRRCLAKVAKIVEADELKQTGKISAQKRKGRA